MSTIHIHLQDKTVLDIDLEAGTIISHSSDVVQQGRSRGRQSSVTLPPEYPEFVVGSRIDADYVVTRMTKIINDFGSATVMDLKDTIGIASRHEDRNFGWTKSGVWTINRVSDGYQILPPIPLRFGITGPTTPKKDPTADWYSVYKGMGGGRWMEIAICEFQDDALTLASSWRSGKVKKDDKLIAVFNVEANDN